MIGLVMCCNCRGRIVVDNAKHAKDILASAKVNKGGPWCDVCRPLEMARQAALIDEMNRAARFRNARVGV